MMNIEQNEKSFAEGLNFYKLFWILVIFSFYGFIFETVADLLQKDVFYSRQGLLYGPFSQIYGIGAILIILISKKIKRRSVLVLFTLSSIFGAGYEYLFSFLEEKIYGFVSWDYYKFPLNLDGRINFIYSIAWGIIGIIIIRWIYPATARCIERIPYKLGKMLTWAMFIFLLYDVFISSAALQREYERMKNIPPSNMLEEYIDEKYPHSYMKAKFPNLIFKENR